MTNPSNQEVVDSIVVRTTEELFAAYEVKVAKQEAPPPNLVNEVLFAGVVGFTGKDMRGTLVLAPTRALLERSYLGATCGFRDWAGELANQLVGRIRNQLRRYGTEVHATTPVILQGQFLASAPRGDQSLHCFAASPGNVAVWFDAELGESLHLIETTNADGPSEGDTVLF